MQSMLHGSLPRKHIVSICVSYSGISALRYFVFHAECRYPPRLRYRYSATALRRACGASCIRLPIYILYRTHDIHPSPVHFIYEPYLGAFFFSRYRSVALWPVIVIPRADKYSRFPRVLCICIILYLYLFCIFIFVFFPRAPPQEDWRLINGLCHASRHTRLRTCGGTRTVLPRLSCRL